MSGGGGISNPVLKGVPLNLPAGFMTFCHLRFAFLTLYRRGTLSPFSGFPDILSENVLIPNPVLKGVEFPRLSVSLTFSQRMCGFLTLSQRGSPLLHPLKCLKITLYRRGSLYFLKKNWFFNVPKSLIFQGVWGIT